MVELNAIISLGSSRITFFLLFLYSASIIILPAPGTELEIGTK